MQAESSNENRANESTSQYQIRPNAGASFPVVGIREIINDVLIQILDGMFNHSFSIIFLSNFYRKNFLIEKVKNTTKSKWVNGVDKS